ncbi:hypothetical protein COW80_02010 [Candidatus Beckwithbacteria bacterium CG22_combo_CG10-13_8_21_14_all_01_47_9]|uniref:Uncharacterized protein n=1 Tax=Candidatus Beckwithbacteria bacterium CG22_combo_CG10-13_8_21_14_all_01_47_9 TaxID=1974496 RepID=A0A2H0E2U1_9BACT|nr:MAG: hypothetical protein COW80_02010 [Candidatus Beckwithbacteria bacterium CG22_combo_CG10-13_8_21_14_all_01_47_9]
MDSAPAPGQAVKFSGKYSVTDVSGSPVLKACVAHWIDWWGGTWLGNDCVDLNTSLSGWQDFSLISPHSGNSSENNIEVNIIQGSGTGNATVNFDNVCLEYIDAPTCSISADSEFIDYNESTNINWNSENADSCTISDPVPVWTGLYGPHSTGPLTANKTYDCSCSGAGGTSDPVSVTVNVAPPAGAWWQADSGNIHADNGGVTSEIPSTCTGACKPYLITGVTGLLSFNGTVNLNGNEINETGPDWQAETKYHGTPTGFSYFQRLLADDPDAEANGVEIYEDFYSTIKEINVANGENRIILVNGYADINHNIYVVPGGFLAIIASGDITVADDVTNVEGVFISDGIFSSGTGNKQLIGEGMFTGWTGISLGRALADNTVTPAEKFIYRPDLLLNAYRYLFSLNIAWREVAP